MTDTETNTIETPEQLWLRLYKILLDIREELAPQLKAIYDKPIDDKA